MAAKSAAAAICLAGSSLAARVGGEKLFELGVVGVVTAASQFVDALDLVLRQTQIGNVGVGNTIAEP